MKSIAIQMPINTHPLKNLIISQFIIKQEEFLPNSINSETVFSFRKLELQHSLYKTIRTSSKVSVEKLFAWWFVALDIRGPPKKRASSSLSRSRAVALTGRGALLPPGASLFEPGGGGGGIIPPLGTLLALITNYVHLILFMYIFSCCWIFNIYHNFFR